MSSWYRAPLCHARRLRHSRSLSPPPPLINVIDTQRLEELAQRLAGVMPPALGPIRTEIEQNLRAVLQSQLPRLELVGREEFEAARSQLMRARERIAELEARIAELEARHRG